MKISMKCDVGVIANERTGIFTTISVQLLPEYFHSKVLIWFCLPPSIQLFCPPPHLLPNEMFKKIVLDCWIRCTFVCLYCLLNLNFIILNKLNQILDYNENHWTCNYMLLALALSKGYSYSLLFACLISPRHRNPVWQQ